MQIQIRLHGALRDVLPVSEKGRTTLNLPAGSTMADLLAHFKFTRPIAAAVNDEVEVEPSHGLQDGDRVEIFAIAGGGVSAKGRTPP